MWPSAQFGDYALTERYDIVPGCVTLFFMEGYQGHISNTPYALFNFRYMDVNHALSQSDMLHTFFENGLMDISIWVLCSPY